MEDRGVEPLALGLTDPRGTLRPPYSIVDRSETRVAEFAALATRVSLRLGETIPE